MNKIFLFVLIKLTVAVSGVPLDSDSAHKVFTKDVDTLEHRAKAILPNRFSKRVAILMRDTTLSGNRFDYQWHKAASKDSRIAEFNYQLPAFLIDSTLAVFCDSLFINDPHNSKLLLTAWPKKSLSTLTKENIRLYIGYVDDKGDRYVVVQFVSANEFKKLQNIYSKELFLVVPNEKLSFVIVNLGH